MVEPLKIHIVIIATTVSNNTYELFLQSLIYLFSI